MSRPTLIAAVVVGVILLGALGTVAGFITFTADPSDETEAAAAEPRSLCDYLEHLLEHGPPPAKDRTPTAVLTDAELGDPVQPVDAVEAPAVGPAADPGPNGAAATYILAQPGLITATNIEVEIPDEIEDDYRLFATELYRLVFEEPGSNGIPSPASVEAAQRLDVHLASCEPG